LERQNSRAVQAAAQAAQHKAIMANAKPIANALNTTLQPATTAATTAAVAPATPAVPAAASPIGTVAFTPTPAQARADLLNYKVTMVKTQSVIILMLMGAVALATGWQMTGELASSPLWQANHNVAQICHADT
jgi:hypothetical protein